jgi:hypothetical protein
MPVARQGSEKAEGCEAVSFGQNGRSTTEILRQVPQSCGIPSHDGTQDDNVRNRPSIIKVLLDFVFR